MYKIEALTLNSVQTDLVNGGPSGLDWTGPIMAIRVADFPGGSW